MYRNYDELKDVQKALRTYINTSRRKTVSKRLAVKTVITEFINTMKIMLPDDLSEALDSLDDEEPGAMVTNRSSEVPAVLADSELWEKVREAGLVDDGGQPTVSRTEAALMANELAERLNVAHKWKLFEALWHRNNMRGDYNTALEQKKSLAFQERLKKILR